MADVGEILRVVAHYTVPGAGDCQNVFHYRVTGEDQTDADVVSFIDTFFTTIWGVAWRAMAATECELTTVDIDVVDVEGLVLRNIGVAVVNMLGTSAGGPMPPGVAGYVAGYTAIPKARGSKYAPGPSEALINEGEFTTTGQAALLGLAAALIATISTGSGAGLVAGVLSKKLAMFVAFEAISAYNTAPAYQRRRRAGVGI